MKYLSLCPNLCVRDVNLSVDFYVQVLGFDLKQSVPGDGSYVWAEVSNGDISLMFQLEENLKAEVEHLEELPIGGSLTLFIRTKGVKELYEKVKDQVEMLKNLNRTFYGATEFTMLDINGYVLTFSEMSEGE